MGYRENYFSENKSNYGWYECIRCGKRFRKGDIDIDHIIPRSYGGSDDLSNLQCMCKYCNRSKRNSLVNTVPDYARNNIERTRKKLFAFWGD